MSSTTFRWRFRKKTGKQGNHFLVIFRVLRNASTLIIKKEWPKWQKCLRATFFVHCCVDLFISFRSQFSGECPLGAKLANSFSIVNTYGNHGSCSWFYQTTFTSFRQQPPKDPIPKRLLLVSHLGGEPIARCLQWSNDGFHARFPVFGTTSFEEKKISVVPSTFVFLFLLSNQASFNSFHWVHKNWREWQNFRESQMCHFFVCWCCITFRTAFASIVFHVYRHRRIHRLVKNVC